MAADIFSKEKRSELMSKVKGKDTKIELIVRRWLHSHGFRYRVNDKRYPGTPDIVLPKYKTAVFIHGCFWHAHNNCRYWKIPGTRSDFWEKKFQQNRERDSKKIRALQDMGWRVIVIWGCELKHNPEGRLISLLQEIEMNMDV